MQFVGQNDGKFTLFTNLWTDLLFFTQFTVSEAVGTIFRSPGGGGAEEEGTTGGFEAQTRRQQSPVGGGKRGKEIHRRKLRAAQTNFQVGRYRYRMVLVRYLPVPTVPIFLR